MEFDPSEIPILWIALGIGGVVVLLVLVGLFIWWWRATADDPRQVADKNDPMRRFAQGVMFIVTRGHDYGYFPAETAREPLVESWDIHDGRQATETVQSLTASEETDPVALAFDLVRAVHVARLAAGAGFLSQEQSWELVRAACWRIQSSFPDWEPVGRGYVVAAAEWCRQRGLEDDTDKNVEWCREFEWPEIPFKRPFG